VKFFYLLLLPLFLYGESNFGVKISTSSQKIHLDQDFKLQLEITHPSGYSIDRNLLRNSVMAPNPMGIYPLFLAKETAEKADRKTSMTYLLKPQYPGIVTLRFSPELPFSIPPLTLEIAPDPSYTASFPPAPLMPLVKGDPLELSLKLRKILYQDSHAEENAAILRSHSYPWGRGLSAVILMLFAPFALVYWMLNRPKDLRVVKGEEKNVLEELHRLKGAAEGDPREVAFRVGELFKEGLEPIVHKETASMTFQELLSNLQGSKWDKGEIGEVKSLCFELENMQFQKMPPSAGEVDGALNKATAVLEEMQVLNKL
jgi:hypothetical protein